MKKAGLGLLVLVLLLGSLPVRAAKASAEEGEHKISLTVESYDEEGKKIKDETDCTASVSTEEAKEGEKKSCRSCSRDQKGIHPFQFIIIHLSVFPISPVFHPRLLRP